uniref:NADH-ubiquinone oxidoreductase chain 4 n=1 Tax=Tamarixia radiata TaxID=459345 RepID=A0A6B9UDT5_9HYME|nr:NADH dehydrogenase subunit 4 [Tamarixia radiata]
MMKLYLFLIMLMISSLMIKNLYMYMYMFIMLMIMMLLFIILNNLNNQFMSIYNWLGMDLMSYVLIILSIFIISLMYMISNKILNNKMFNLLMMMLLLSLMLSFNSMNYFMFYLFFEISLIPTFLLITMFGYQPERLNAGMYMMLYTLFASLPLLLIIFMLFYKYNSIMMFMLFNLIYNINLINSFIFYFFMLFAFLVKLPMFMYHMWLPKAHVEAPVSGSMILAGVMLKLGGYGLIRSMSMMMKYSVKYNWMLIILNLMGMILLSMLCLRQIDLKVLVAYSSVVHMSMMLSSMMLMLTFSKYSSIIMMLGHGFCSPAMFMLVNFFYERTCSRNLLINKGLINLFPSMMFMWFMFCIMNMGVPLSLNFISELFIMFSLLSFSKNLILFLIISMLLSAMYSMYLFISINHGQMNLLMKNLFNNKMLEFHSLIILLIPLNFFFLKMDFMI